MTRINNTRSSDLRENKAREEVEYTFEEQDVLHIPEPNQSFLLAHSSAFGSGVG